MIRLIIVSILVTLSINSPLYSIETNKKFEKTDNSDILEKSNRFKNLHKSIALDPSLSNDEKLFFIFDSLLEAKKTLSKQELKFVATDIEPLIFQESADPKISTLQVDFIASFVDQNGEYWPFIKTKEEVNKFVDIKVRNLLKDSKNQFYRFGQILREVQYLINLGDYHNALIKTNLFESEFNIEKNQNSYLQEMDIFWKMIVDGIKFKIYYQSADLKNASIYADKMDAYIQLALKNKLVGKEERYDFIKKAIIGMPGLLDYDFTMGKYDRVINTGLLIVSSFDINYNNLEEVRAFSNLHKAISDAYFAKGDQESAKKGTEHFNTYLDLYRRAPEVSMEYLFSEITKSLYERDLKKFNLFWTYYDTSLYQMDTKTKKIYIDAKKIILRDTDNYFQSSSAEQEKILNRLWLDLAFYMEVNFYLNLDGQTAVPINRLSSYEYIYNFFILAKEKKYAAIYAKKYINTLQDYRKQLKQFNENDFKFFTEKNSDNLKKFSSNFYDISDYDSAISTMRILKENDFLDFVRRSNDSENFLTQISLSDKERDYFARMELIADQIRILNQSNNNGNNNSASLKDSIEKRKKEFILLQKLYKQSLNKEDDKSKVKNNKIYKFDYLNLADNEAALIFSINLNHIDVQFYEHNSKPQIFRGDFKDNSFAINVLSIQKNLSQNKNINENLWSSLSKNLFDLPTNANGNTLASYISSRTLKKIKIQSDGYLNLMPLTLIPIENQQLGSKYVLEKIGLSSKNMAINNNVRGIDAYGATKGNSEFNSNLPGVKNEIESIMEVGINTKNKRIFIDEKFTKENFYNSFQNNIEFIHLATHFKFATSATDSSKMLLGDGSSLTLDEIRTDIKPISTYLLTLSACNTAESISSKDITRSYEGLSNVFQVKGAKNIISTLWEIDDQATADFMTVFYSILLNNEISPSEALFYTQNIYRTGSLDNIKPFLKFPNDRIGNRILSNISKYKQPYYWAAFQISSIN